MNVSIGDEMEVPCKDLGCCTSVIVWKGTLDVTLTSQCRTGFRGLFSVVTAVTCFRYCVDV